MCAIIRRLPKVLHSLPGRVRLHLPDWSGSDPASLDRCFHRVPGVRRVRANPVTGNVLIEYDTRLVKVSSLLRVAAGVRSRAAGLLPPDLGRLVFKTMDILTAFLARSPVQLILACLGAGWLIWQQFHAGRPVW
jgi:hypothetical protein